MKSNLENQIEALTKAKESKDRFVVEASIRLINQYQFKYKELCGHYYIVGENK